MQKSTFIYKNFYIYKIDKYIFTYLLNSLLKSWQLNMHLINTHELIMCLNRKTVNPLSENNVSNTETNWHIKDKGYKEIFICTENSIPVFEMNIYL